MKDKKQWLVVPPYDSPWLAPFVPQKKYVFETIPPYKEVQSWHFHNRLSSSLNTWWNYWKQSAHAWEKKHDGIITVFPQLAAMVALRKKLSGSKIPIVAWSFNLGQLYPGFKQQIARKVFPAIDAFVVHSKGECIQYSEWLKIPKKKFHFVPLQIGKIPHFAKEDMDDPFIISMGSAQRDYVTLFESLRQLNIKTIVVAAPHAVKGLQIPSCVSIKCGLSREQCQELCQKARLSVIPISNQTTASGQVTLVEAMRMGRPVIATRCMGTEDYIIQGETGILTEFKSVDSLTNAIQTLWNDANLREGLGKQGELYAEKHFSDEAIGQQLGQLLDTFKD